MIKPLLASAALLLCGSAFAADSPALTKCMASAQTTASMLDCQGQALKIQDIRLNAAYKKAMASIDQAHKKPLQDVQRMWLKYRDANCMFLSTLTGGSMDRLNTSSCFLDMTQTRAQELENLSGL